MDFTKAVNAHVAWKVKLLSAISGGEKLDHAIVCKDNQCELGKWIYGEGAIHGSKVSYEPLRTKHAHFHKCAGDVVVKVNAGDKTGATAMLGAGSAFANASTDTVSAIVAMRKELGL